MCSSDLIANNLQNLHPTTRQLFTSALEKPVKAWEVFRDQHLQAELTRQVAQIFKEEIDVLLVPTTTCHPTIQEMEADPIGLNAKLGYFTHFANVLDLCGIALPASTYSTSEGTELPFGVTLIGASGMDGKIMDIAREFERAE